MITRIAVIALWAEDVPATANFYRNVIGLNLLHHPGARPHFEVNGIYMTILKGRPVAAQDTVPDRFPLVAFAVDDLEAMVERLRAHKVVLPWGIEQDAASRWVMFQDPAGNMIELVQFGR
jgi:catechol-2,3-dioxygenase